MTNLKARPATHLKVIDLRQNPRLALLPPAAERTTSCFAASVAGRRKREKGAEAAAPPPPDAEKTGGDNFLAGCKASGRLLFDMARRQREVHS